VDNPTSESLFYLLERALEARGALFDSSHQLAFRLFNGFYEGAPDLAVDLYARTLALHDYSEGLDSIRPEALGIVQFYQDHLPWLQAAILKIHKSPQIEERRGEIIFGSRLDKKVRENGVWYAINLRLNQDTSLYLDTRIWRAWAKQNLADKTVLNTFAYTGSLGVAATAGGARKVIQVDRNRVFLNLAKDSYSLNGFPIDTSDFLAVDFWRVAGQYRRSEQTFDCVLLDPPFFASDDTGVVDLNQENQRLINKVRPLIADGGLLVAVNNAIYVSGAEYIAMLETLAIDGYLSIEELIPVPEDFTGYPQTQLRPPLVDPAPFNHSTKIAVLRIRRKLPAKKT
jgi:23S rRNA (cytosine1962-C5)-methyltransferase